MNARKKLLNYRRGRDASTATLRGTFRSAFTLSAIGSALNAIVAVASGVATARIYGVETVGGYAVAYAPTAAVWYLSSIREQPALVRALATLRPREPRATALFGAVFAFSEALTLIVSTVAGVVSYVVLTRGLHHASLAWPAIAMLASYAMFGNPGWNVDSVFAGFRAGREVLQARLGQAVSFLLLAIGGSFVTKGVWGLAGALVFSYTTSFIHRIVLARNFLTMRVTKADLREGLGSLPAILGFGLRATPGTLAAGVSSESGTWILAAAGTVSAVGAWSRAAMFSSRLMDVTSRVGDMLLPTLVERRREAGDDAYDRALIDSIRYLAMLLLLPAAVGGGAARGLLHLFGPGFAAASTALAVVLLFPVLMMIIGMQSQALLAEGRPLATTVLETSRMTVTVTVSVVVSFRYGIVGPALGLVAGGLVEACLQYRIVRGYLRRQVGHWWPPRAMASLGAAYAAGFAASHYSESLVSGYGGLMLALVAGSVSYVVTLAVGGVLDRDRERFAGIRAERSTRRARSCG